MGAELSQPKKFDSPQAELLYKYQHWAVAPVNVPGDYGKAMQELTFMKGVTQVSEVPECSDNEFEAWESHYLSCVKKIEVYNAESNRYKKILIILEQLGNNSANLMFDNLPNIAMDMLSAMTASPQFSNSPYGEVLAAALKEEPEQGQPSNVEKVKEIAAGLGTFMKCLVNEDTQGALKVLDAAKISSGVEPEQTVTEKSLTQ